ncbi:MAG TPA: ABC transporter ATP-binding protein [Candidatus Binatia bacterium]|nr:ABC transporter ATP-binding protein [Candidatus Binatia bacterium]
MNSAVPAIEISRLTKRYGALTAVDDVSLTVEAGDFFGFLGPNGAGKTTTINSIVGLAKITSGTIKLFGHDVVKDWRAARRLVGIAPQEYNFDRYLSIRDIIIYEAGYYGLPRRAVEKRADDLLELFDLGSKANDGYLKLSGGMKRRLTLARAMIHSPRLMILDEPTAGVDVELRIELWEMLRRLNAEGITIFLTTHYLEEAESLCRNIGIIEGGRLVALESTAKLVARRNDTVLTITVDRPIRALPPELVARGATLDPSDVVIHLQGILPSEIASALTEIERAGFIIEDMEYKRSSLQDVFLELTRR